MSLSSIFDGIFGHQLVDKDSKKETTQADVGKELSVKEVRKEGIYVPPNLNVDRTGMPTQESVLLPKIDISNTPEKEIPPQGEKLG